MSSLPTRAFTAWLVLAAPAATLACEASIAAMVLKRQHEQAATLFVRPDGSRDPQIVAGLSESLRRATDLVGATGEPMPVTTQATRGATSARIDVGFRPADGVAFRKTTFAVESAIVPGLLVNLLATPQASGCGVFGLQFETYDQPGVMTILFDRL